MTKSGQKKKKKSKCELIGHVAEHMVKNNTIFIMPAGCVIAIFPLSFSQM